MTRIGGFWRQHGAHLHRRGVRAQQQPRAVGLRREIEGVVHFPRRMAFREIQFGEVVVVGLDIGTFRHRETHVGEDGGELVGHLADRMHAAGFGRRLAHRQRDVDGSVLRRASSAGRRGLLGGGDRGGDAILQPLIAGPCTLRSSGVIEPSVLSSAIPSRSCRARQRAPLPAPLRPWRSNGGRYFLLKRGNVAHSWLRKSRLVVAVRPRSGQAPP